MKKYFKIAVWGLLLSFLIGTVGLADNLKVFNPFTKKLDYVSNLTGYLTTTTASTLYVPYTGANNDVDLDSHGFTANSINSTGGSFSHAFLWDYFYITDHSIQTIISPMILDASEDFLDLQIGGASKIKVEPSKITLGAYTTDGFVKTSGTTGQLDIDTNTYVVDGTDTLATVVSNGPTTLDPISTGDITITGSDGFSPNLPNINFNSNVGDDWQIIDSSGVLGIKNTTDNSTDFSLDGSGNMTWGRTSGTMTVPKGGAIVGEATSGFKIGTASTQKFSIYNATPIAQQGATTDLGLIMSNFGLRVAGTAYPITTSGAVTLGSLTSTRIPIAGTSGLLGDDADLTFTGGNLLNATNLTVTTALKNTALTSGRMVFTTTGGQLTDDSDFTFLTDTATVTKIKMTEEIHLGTAPTLGSCGVTPSISAESTDYGGKVTTGTGVFTSCAITFANAKTNAPACWCNDETSVVVCQAVSSTSTVTFNTVGALTSNTLAYGCVVSE